MIQRFGPPNQYDQYPKNTICKVIISEDGDPEFWVQVGNDEESPKWLKLDGYQEIEG